MRQWSELVAEGRQAVEVIGANKWALGDLALEVEPPSANGVGNGSGGRLRQYADEIGIGGDALRVYRDVAKAWPAPTRVGASWSAHRECMARPEVLRELAARGGRVGMNAVRDALGKASPRGPEETRHGFERLPAADRAALVAEALDDDEVRAAPAVQQRLKRATEDEMRAAAGRSSLRHISAGAPIGVLDALGAIRTQLKAIHDTAVDERVDWSTMRGSVADSLRAIAQQSLTVASIVEDPNSGRVTDEALAALLDGR